MSSVSKKNVTKEIEEIDLSRVIGEVIDHRKLIISITALFTLLSIMYVIFTPPIYQADALIQVEQKQGNALLNSLTQVLPDSQPQSAPEIALLQSRMILGKTVDDLNLQAKLQEEYAPFLGQGWARLMGRKPGVINISRIYIPGNNDENVDIQLKVESDEQFSILIDGREIRGNVGKLLTDKRITIYVEHIEAQPGTEFRLTYISKLRAITNLQQSLSINDQGKDTGMLNISLTGEDPLLIKQIIDSISDNYLSQNIARQAAQNAKSLEFLNQQLPKVRSELDISENKLNAYRRQNDSVDLSLEAKSVLEQIVNVDNQLNELTFKESEISQLYTKEHPTYKALMEKRKTLQDERTKLNKRVSAMPETQTRNITF
ncbi:Putative tyrosine-protein kinase in cps region [Raoultella ornithinolytica]|nr:Putative tyrosine-protein kinase in cps region [Raoultella ornithinolytica]